MLTPNWGKITLYVSSIYQFGVSNFVLDNQLYDSFVAARSLVGEVSQAETIDDLRARLQTEGGEVVCTTIEKFALKEGEEPISNFNLLTMP